MEREDHDQRLKSLIKEFFPDFMRLFFSDWEECLDFQHPEWITQEAFPEPPDGPRRLMDLVARIDARRPAPDYHTAEQEPKKWLALIHVEIESPDSMGNFGKRMFEYDIALENAHGLPVLPIALFLNIAYDGIGEKTYVRHFYKLKKLEFRYLYVGLRGLDALQYVQGDNWLGIALSAMMRIPAEQAARLAAEALRRLTEAPITERQRYLLAECFQAYLPMDEQQQQEFNQLLEAKPYAGVKAMNKTVFERGREEGIEKGRMLERRETLRELVADRFGTLSTSINERIEQLPFEQLALLIRRVYQVNSLKELGLED